MSLPNVGTHVVKPIGKIICALREDGTGGLQAFIPLEVCEGQDAGARITAIRTIVTKEEVVQQNEVQNLVAIFELDSSLESFLSLGDSDQSNRRMAAVVVDEEYNGKTSRRVKWLNPIGGGGMKMPVASDRNAVLAKYGSKFRALYGSKPTTSTATTVTPKSEKESAPPKPSTPVVASTMDETWERLQELMTGKPEAEISSRWLTTMGQMFPGKENADLSPGNWGEMKARFESELAAK